MLCHADNGLDLIWRQYLQLLVADGKKPKEEGKSAFSVDLEAKAVSSWSKRLNDGHHD